MKVKFGDLEDAFLFVSMTPPFTHSAVLCRDTGKFYYKSELGDVDEMPEDVDDEKYLEVPHKNDLDLGKALVLGFASEHLPDEVHEVDRIFSRKGAYARFKQLLENRGLLQEWYDYENQRTKTALKEWCANEGIEVVG